MASRPGPAVRDDPTVVALVTRAAGSDQGAWDEIVERYAPLVWSICTGFRLSNHDVEDVAQNVWLLLVGQLGTLREPAGGHGGPQVGAAGDGAGRGGAVRGRYGGRRGDPRGRAERGAAGGVRG